MILSLIKAESLSTRLYEICPMCLLIKSCMSNVNYASPVGVCTTSWMLILCLLQQVSKVLHCQFNVRQRITAAYHPQSNGLDERTNQTIRK